MGYSNYKKLRQVVDKFGLITKKVRLFHDINPVQPTDWLIRTIELADAIPLSNEKVKSERIISPVLTEVHQMHKSKVALFSGEELNVEPENDLNGACDFCFSANPEAYLLEAPIVSLAEARDEDLDYGIAQCAAQMIGAQKYNLLRGDEVPIIFGCATTAGEWKFLKLEGNTLYIDLKSYYINQLDILLGAFNKVFA